MSNTILELVLASKPFGNPSHKIVMVVLADRADVRGHCFPGIADLAHRTGFSARTVLRCISDLEADGWIKVNRNSVGPRRTGNSYVLDVDMLRRYQQSKGANLAPIEFGICDTVASVKVTPETSIGDIDGPLYRKNPHEPSDEPKATNYSAFFFRDEDVECIYVAYPRQIGRIRALIAIRKAVARIVVKYKGELTTEAALQFLERKAQSFARSPAGRRGDYTPYPATWFNEDRYEDDESEWSDAKQSKWESNGKGDGSGLYESPAVGRNARSSNNIRGAFAKLRSNRSGGDAHGADQEQLSITRIDRADVGNLGSDMG